MALGACSVFTSFDDFTGGEDELGDGALVDGVAEDGGTGDAQRDAGALDSGPTCQQLSGQRCLADAPLGWVGPFEFFHGGGTPPSCGGAFPTPVMELEGLHGGTVSGSPATCPGCTLFGATGISCSATIDLVSTGASSCMSGCNDGGAPVATEPLNTCFAIPSCSNTNPTTLYATPTATGGTCNAAPAGSPLKPPVTWTENVRGCSGETPVLDCSGNICFTTPESPFTGAACVLKSGNQACPGPPYNMSSYTAYARADDTRTCTGCSASISNQDCQLIEYHYSDPSCTTSTGSTLLNATCNNNYKLDAGVATKVFASTPTATCTLDAGSSVPIGSVLGPDSTTSVTVCCTASLLP